MTHTYPIIGFSNCSKVQSVAGIGLERLVVVPIVHTVITNHKHCRRVDQGCLDVGSDVNCSTLHPSCQITRWNGSSDSSLTLLFDHQLVVTENDINVVQQCMRWNCQWIENHTIMGSIFIKDVLFPGLGAILSAWNTPDQRKSVWLFQEGKWHLSSFLQPIRIMILTRSDHIFVEPCEVVQLRCSLSPHLLYSLTVELVGAQVL